MLHVCRSGGSIANGECPSFPFLLRSWQFHCKGAITSEPALSFISFSLHPFSSVIYLLACIVRYGRTVLLSFFRYVSFAHLFRCQFSACLRTLEGWPHTSLMFCCFPYFFWDSMCLVTTFYWLALATFFLFLFPSIYHLS
jgi:hypothetical protein